MTKTTAARTANKLPDFLDGADEAAASTAGGGHAGEHPHAAEAAAARSDAAPAPATTNRAAWVGAPIGGRPRWTPSVLSGSATSVRSNSRIPLPVTARARPDSSHP